MNYIICIPSYKRPEILKEKTLKMLQSHNIDPNIIYIFVADIEEAAKKTSGESKSLDKTIKATEREIKALQIEIDERLTYLLVF